MNEAAVNDGNDSLWFIESLLFSINLLSGSKNVRTSLENIFKKWRIIHLKQRQTQFKTVNQNNQCDEE